MKKFLIPLFAGLLLAGCGTDPAKVMGTAEMTFTKAVLAADVIAQQPRCPAEPVCVEQSTVDDLVKAADAGDLALDKGWEALARFDGVEGTDAVIDAAVDVALSAADLFASLVNKARE